MTVRGGFEDLECWKAGRRLKLFVIEQVLPTLPAEERFRLRDQLLRASRSITANIAEGYGRFHFLDRAKFLSNARGSCFEVLDHVISAVDERLVDEALLAEIRTLVDETGRLINGYMSYLKRVAQGSGDVGPGP